MSSNPVFSIDFWFACGMMLYKKVSLSPFPLGRKIWKSRSFNGEKSRVENACKNTNRFPQSLWWGKLERQGTVCWLKKRAIHGTWYMVHLIFFWSLISSNLTKFQLIRTTFISHRKMSSECLSEYTEIFQGFTKS